MRFWRRTFKQWRGRIIKKKTRKKLLIASGLIVLSLCMVHKFVKPSQIDHAAYIPLLNTIAKGESGGNYNAYFGHPSNADIRFTDMTVGEVMQWQVEYVGQGNVSNAVGKYQIVSPTLTDLVNKLDIDRNEKFDETLQDKLAIALLERRGAVDYVNSKLTREQFAANLAMEWAALPKVTGPNPHESYYSGDGVNKSNITVDDMNKALGTLRDAAQSSVSNRGRDL